MTSFLKNEKHRKRFEWMLDALSLGAVLQYCAYRFLQSTMFNFYYSITYKLITMGLLVVFGGARYLYVIINKLKGYEEKRDRIIFLLRCVGAWLLALPFFYVGWLHDYKVLIFLPICCMCLYNMEAGKICRWFVFTIGTILAATVLCCLSGTVRNLVYVENEHVIGAYGTINTTDFASYFTFLLLACWYGTRQKGLLWSVAFAIVSGIVSYVAFWLTHSNTALVSGVFLIVFVLWDYICEVLSQRSSQLCEAVKRMNQITVLAFPFIGALIVILVILYGRQNDIAIKINGLLSGRLEAIINPYNKFGIHPFGSQIEKLHGQGATLLSTWSTGYGYLDTAYALLAIRYGWVITGVITGIWVWITAKMLWTGNRRVAFALTILALHAISEARILDINYNILLVLPFCSFDEKTEQKRLLEKDRRVGPKFVLIFLFILMYLGGLSLILPKTLSWLRSIFSIKEWLSGTSAIWSLLACIFIIGMTLLFGAVVIKSIIKLKSRYFFSLAGILIVFIGVFVLSDNMISKECRDQTERIESERDILRQVQQSTTRPIYASERSEIYNRTIGGFKDHIFSTEELHRSPKGSIITDNNVEALSLTAYGAYYTDLTPWSGIYTFDPEVVSMLKASGYELHQFYSGEHVCNLEDMALFNDLKPSKGGYPVLSGPTHITTSNAEADQYGGGYEVSFIIELVTGLPMNTDRICSMEVLGEAGEQMITKEEIYKSDFDSNGYCQKTITYWIPSTPKVSFGINVSDGAEIRVHKISWRRKP